MKSITISAYEAWINKEGIAMPGCKPYDADFYTEMYRIKNGYYKYLIDQCRSISNKDERNRFKCEKLPSLTISAVCKDWRKMENVVRHTGLLNLDIDAAANKHIENWGELRDLIFKRPLVVCAFLSASGNGLSFVVRVDPAEHKDVFFSIVDECKEHLGIKIDAALHDIVRLRFVSYDPEMKIRDDFDKIPLCRPSTNYLKNKKNYGQSAVPLEPVGLPDSLYNFNEAVKRTEQTYQFADGQKHVYLVSLAGGCNIMGITQEYCEQSVLNKYGRITEISEEQLLRPVRSVYRTYKHQHGSFHMQIKNDRLNKKIIDVIVKDFLHEGKEPGEDNLLMIARENDANMERVRELFRRVWGEYEDELGFNKFPAIKKVEVWLKKRWKFRFNQITGQPELINLGETEAELINFDEIYRQLQLHWFKFSLNNVKSLLKSAFVKPYDPIKDYFNSLPPPDGKDSIETLARHVSIVEHDSNQDFWITQFKKTLVRCIACGLGIEENRIVLVLRSEKQATGKTTFIRYLSPWGVKKYYTESSIIKGDKDSEFRFSENFIYNLEELAALNNHDIERLKAVISKKNIKERRVYDTYEQEKPRRCNFFASTNQDLFLKEFENTRWLIFDTEKIDWSYFHNINIYDVWSEAWYLFNSGFDYHLTPAEADRQAKKNEEFRQPLAEEELIVRHFKPADPGDIGGVFYTSAQIAGWLGQHYGMRLSPVNIGKAIHKIFGLKRKCFWIDSRPVKGYWMTKTEEYLAAEDIPF